MRDDAMPPTFARLALLLSFLALVAPASSEAQRRFPDVVVVAVDTLRYDRLSIHGYHRPTSPRIDALLRRGARFEEMRVVEPLTAPSMASIFTGLYPHEHGATRNGLRLRPGIESLTSVLSERGYVTSAIVGNWTLRSELLGLDEHFDHYEGVWSRKRYFGLFNSEATAEDLNDAALGWVDDHLDRDQRWPFLLWVHYVEPHEPYQLQRDFVERLDIPRKETPSDRYDTEVAFVDRAIGRFLEELAKRVPSEDLLIVFVSDHGESLGEHSYWGHGRHLYEPTLHIPAGFVWDGRIAPDQAIRAPATSLDLPPTILGLLGLPVPASFRGQDFSSTLLDGAEAQMERKTFHEAHKGAAHGDEAKARRNGLLEVGVVENARHKEILRVKRGRDLRVFDLETDPNERFDQVEKDEATPSETLATFLERVREGLEASDELPPAKLSDEDRERLRALGYID